MANMRMGDKRKRSGVSKKESILHKYSFAFTTNYNQQQQLWERISADSIKFSVLLYCEYLAQHITCYSS